jgi:hypothetical protein
MSTPIQRASAAARRGWRIRKQLAAVRKDARETSSPAEPERNTTAPGRAAPREIDSSSTAPVAPPT